MMSLSLKERFERLGPVEDVDRDPSGSPAAISLRLELPTGSFRSISAVRVLAANGMSMLAAKRAIERVMEKGQVAILLPRVKDQIVLADELGGLGLIAKALAVRRVDAKAVRLKLGLTQDQFALRFGIDLETLRNWEQGKRSPDMTAQSYLRAIELAPDAVEAAQEDDMLQTR
jgi:putative transcriptional regulator